MSREYLEYLEEFENQKRIGLIIPDAEPMSEHEFELNK